MTAATALASPWRSDSAWPQVKVAKGWPAGAPATYNNSSKRAASSLLVSLNSLSMALTSRATMSGLKLGETKNCAKISKASRNAPGSTSK